MAKDPCNELVIQPRDNDKEGRRAKDGDCARWLSPNESKGQDGENFRGVVRVKTERCVFPIDLNQFPQSLGLLKGK